jgi:hypothetical protein
VLSKIAEYIDDASFPQCVAMEFQSEEEWKCSDLFAIVKENPHQ